MSPCRAGCAARVQADPPTSAQDVRRPPQARLLRSHRQRPGRPSLPTIRIPRQAHPSVKIRTPECGGALMPSANAGARSSPARVPAGACLPPHLHGNAEPLHRLARDLRTMRAALPSWRTGLPFEPAEAFAPSTAASGEAAGGADGDGTEVGRTPRSKRTHPSNRLVTPGPGTPGWEQRGSILPHVGLLALPWMTWLRRAAAAT